MRQAFLRQTAGMHILDDADDLAAIVGRERHEAAEGAVGEEALREQSADDHHLPGRAFVRLDEGPALEQRDADHVEEAGGDARHRDLRALGLGSDRVDRAGFAQA